jgi:hypothetical protein
MGRVYSSLNPNCGSCSEVIDDGVQEYKATDHGFDGLRVLEVDFSAASESVGFSAILLDCGSKTEETIPVDVCTLTSTAKTTSAAQNPRSSQVLKPASSDR